MTPESLFSQRIAADSSRPLVTFYDDDSGERVELSVRSMGNWIAKTHFLLLDELGLGPGSRAFLRLPVHWLAMPIIFGCWFAGLELVSEPGDADVAFGDSHSLLGTDLSGIDEVFAVSLLSMARSADPPAGMVDFATAVRPQPDAWGGVRAQAAAAAPALDGSSRARLVDRARAQASTTGLSEGGRLLFARPSFGPEEWVTAILGPVVIGGSVVLVRNAAQSKLADRVQSERITVSLC